MIKKEIRKVYSNAVIPEPLVLYRYIPDIILGTVFSFIVGFLGITFITSFIVEDVSTFQYMVNIFLKWPLSYFGYFQDDFQMFVNSINPYKLSSIMMLNFLFSTAAAFHFSKPRINGFIPENQKLLIDSENSTELFKKELKQKFGAISKSQKKELELVKDLPLSSKIWTQSMIIMGAVGGGKTTIIKPLLKQIFDLNEICILFDFKGEFTSFFYDPKKVFLLGITDIRSSVWDISYDIETRLDAIEFCNMIIPTNKDNPMWTNAAQAILLSIILKLQNERPRNWNARMLMGYTNYAIEEIAKVVKKYNPNAYDMVKEVNVTTSGIMINMKSFLQPIIELAMIEHSQEQRKKVVMFSIKKWINGDTEQKQVILQGDIKCEKSYVPLFSTIIGYMKNYTLSSGTFEDNDNRRIWFVMDEFQRLGKVDFQPFIATGRSKGIRTILGFQDISQLEIVYSKNDVNALMSMIGTQIYVKINNGATEKFIQETCGKQNIVIDNVSGKVGLNHDRQISKQTTERFIVGNGYLTRYLGKLEAGHKYVHGLVVNSTMSNYYNIEFPFVDIPTKCKPVISGNVEHEKEYFSSILSQSEIACKEHDKTIIDVEDIIKEKDAEIKSNAVKEEIKQLEKNQRDLIIAYEKLSIQQKALFFSQLKINQKDFSDNNDDELEMLIFDEINGLSFHFIDMCFDIIDGLTSKKELSQNI